LSKTAQWSEPLPQIYSLTFDPSGTPFAALTLLLSLSITLQGEVMTCAKTPPLAGLLINKTKGIPPLSVPVKTGYYSLPTAREMK
jgi:hypothetical protein